MDWINPLGLNKRLELGVHYVKVKDAADIALVSGQMRNVDIIEKSLKILELTSNYSNYEVLNFLSCYQNLEIYINSFLDLMSEKLFNVSDKKEILNIFNELNESNWKEIDSYNYKQDKYYIFLRLKVFLLTVDYETDLKEDHEWLNFFKRKFIEYLDEN
ncbi:hypothetical protein ACSVHK_16950 [Acinetobacter nosocomialis]|uniref:hypothetical protein n=1 Tax=Acinetobacter calcoaceticus/baumannii complex TaxID=909768 RepID=UPI0035A23890